MWNPERPMNAILAAAEAGKGELPSESELRARLEVLIQQVKAERGRWSVQRRGEYQAICDALDRLATKGAT